MVEVYSVETSLLLNSQMQRGLRQLSEQLRTIQGQVDKLKTALNSPSMMIGQLEQVRALSKAWGGVKTSIRDAASAIQKMSPINEAVLKSASSLSTRMGNAAKNTERLNLAMAGIKPVPGLPGGPGGRGPGGRGPHGPFYGRFHQGPIGAHVGMSVGDAIGAGAGFGMFEGIKYAAEEQMANYYTMLAAGINPRSSQGKAYMAKVRQVAEETSLGTIFSRPDVMKMFPGIAGAADVPLEQVLPFAKTAIRFGEIEQQFGAAIGKNFDSKESSAALITLAHLLGITTPAEMDPVADRLIAATTTTKKSPAQLVNVLQYMIGSASALGMSGEDAVNLGALGSILAPGTRAGTGLNMFLTGLMPKAGPGAGTKIHEKDAKRLATLKSLGFIDPATNRPYSDPMKLIQALHADYKKMPGSELYGTLTSLFEQRGARMVYELARNEKIGQMLTELRTREEAVRAMGGSAGIQNIAQDTLKGQALGAWANLKTILSDLGESTVPGLTGALHGLNTVMRGIRGYFDANPGAKATVAYGGIGLAALAGINMLRKFGGFAFGRGGPKGGPGGAAAPRGGLGGMFSALFKGLMIGNVLSELGDNFSVIPTEAKSAAEAGGMWHGNWSASQSKKYSFWDELRHPFGGDKDNWPDWVPRGRHAGVGETGATSQQVSLTGTATFNGDIHLNFGQLGEIVAHAVAQGIMRAGMGGTVGSTSSPDISGGMPIPSAVY